MLRPLATTVCEACYRALRHSGEGGMLPIITKVWKPRMRTTHATKISGAYDRTGTNRAVIDDAFSSSGIWTTCCSRGRNDIVLSLQAAGACLFSGMARSLLAHGVQCAKVGTGSTVLRHSHGCSTGLHASSTNTDTTCGARLSFVAFGPPHTKSPRPAAAVGFAPFGAFFSPAECLVWCCVCARALLRRQ